MNGAIKYIADKFGVSIYDKSPIQLNITRVDLASLFSELNYKVGAEIGVEQGLFSEELCKANPDLYLYCIDPWKIETHQHFPFIEVTQVTMELFYMQTITRLVPYKCNIIRSDSLEATKLFKPNTLDFVFIDGNHSFDYVINDIIEWSKIVRPGGIISGHDYRPNDVDGIDFHVMVAVNAYIEVHKISPWFIITDEGTSSWFWVKPKQMV